MKNRILFCVIILCAFLLPAMAVRAAEPVFSEPDFDVRVTGAVGVINFRSGPGTDYSVITEIYNGEHLHITDLSFNWEDRFLWGKVTYGNMEGWVSLRQTSLLDGEEYKTPDFYVVTIGEEEPVFLREGTGINTAQLLEIPVGEQLHITDLSYNAQDEIFWGRTVYRGTEGWVAMGRVEIDHSGVVRREWHELYREFLEEKDFISLSHAKKLEFPDAEMFPADLDADQVPELFVYTGTGEIEGDSWDVFAYSGDRISLLGTVAGYPYGSDPEKGYPGVFFAEGDHMVGNTKYISVAEGSLKEEILTERVVDELTGGQSTETVSENTDLRAAGRRAREALDIEYYTDSQIRAMGVEEFFEAFGFVPASAQE